MPLEESDFLETLRELQLVPEDRLRKLIDPQSTQPLDVDRLCSELSARGWLTDFQVRMLRRGSGHSLLLGGYLIEAAIGAGGMGRVYRARHRMMDRIVAIKVLQRRTLRNADSLERFQREVKVAATLHHPNVVTAYDAGEANGVPYLVMEFVDGRDLATMVSQGGQLHAEQALEIILQAALALDYAHSKGVIHRDVKPANFLIDQLGNVKLLDLGLARWNLEHEGEPQRDLTSEGIVLGTVHFLSPEQASGGQLDHRTDIYSLGCTLYYLLTGDKVFPSEKSVDTLFAHCHQAPPRLTDQLPDLDPAIDELFQWMVKKTPLDRPSSMAVVANRVTELLSRFEHRDSRELRLLVGSRSPTKRISDLSEGDILILEDATSGRRKIVKRRGSLLKVFLIACLAAVCVSVALWQFAQRANRRPEPDPPVPLPPPPQLAATPMFVGLRFDGVNSEAVIPNWTLPEETPLTIEVEVTPEIRTTYGAILSHYEEIDGWMLGLCGDRWCLTISQGGIPHARLVSSEPVRWEEKERLAVVFDGNRAAFYREGKLEVEWTTSTPMYRLNQQTLRLGRATGNNTDNEFRFGGVIHCIRVSDIDRFANPGNPGEPLIDEHTIGFYDCTQQQGGNRLVDSSPLARHGELRNAVWLNKSGGN